MNVVVEAQDAPANMPLSEMLARAAEREVALLDAAIAACEAARAASVDEDAVFCRWMKFERDANYKLLVHGNSVKAAERRHDNAALDARLALHQARTVDGRISDAYGADVESDELLAVLQLVREEQLQRIAMLRGPEPCSPAMLHRTPTTEGA